MKKDNVHTVKLYRDNKFSANKNIANQFDFEPCLVVLRVFDKTKKKELYFEYTSLSGYITVFGSGDHETVYVEYMGKENKEDNEQIHEPVIGLVYTHYKGGLYEPLFVAHNTVTEELDVVYRSHARGTVYTRPLKEWFEEVETTMESPYNTRFYLS